MTSAKVGEAVQRGDATALRVWEIVGSQLGEGLAVLVGVLNPEAIIFGSVYPRHQELLEPVALQVLQEERLLRSLAACQILPAGLGGSVGVYAGISVAMEALHG